MKARKIIFSILFIVATIAIILPMLYGTMHSVPYSDDYDFEWTSLNAIDEYGNEIKAAIKASLNMYENWEGTYVSDCIIYYIRPYSRWGLKGYQTVMTLNLLFYVFSMMFLFRTLFKKNWHLPYLMALIMTACITDYWGFKELFYWYVGAFQYSFNLSFAFLALGFLILLFENDNKGQNILYAIMSCGCGFIASGGSLEIAAANCAVLLLFLVYNVRKLKEKVLIAFPFIVAVINAAISAFAPGNFKRSEGYMENDGISKGIIDAVFDTFTCWVNEHKQILGNYFFILLLVVLFFFIIIGNVIVISDHKLDIKNILLFAVGLVFAEYITAFPVCYGYHSSELTYKRTSYSYRLIASILIIFFVACLAQYVAQEIKKKNISSKIVSTVAIITTVICISGAIGSYKESIHYLLITDSTNGIGAEFYANRVDILDRLSSAEKGSNVYIIEPTTYSNALLGPGITENKDDYVNQSVSRFFGLNSVVVEFKD